MEQLICQEIEKIKSYLSCICHRRSKTEIICLSAGCLAAVLLFLRHRRKKVNYFKKDEIRCDEPYNGHELPTYIPKTSVIDGWLKIRIVDWIMRSPLRERFFQLFIKTSKLDMLLHHDIRDSPTMQPIVDVDSSLYQRQCLSDDDVWKLIDVQSRTNEFSFHSISDYVDGFRNGRFTPTDVARKILQVYKEMEKLEKAFNIVIEYREDLILEAAEKSTQRWRTGKPLSVFDGVPVAFKDQFYVDGYYCRNGTQCSFYSEQKTKNDMDGFVKKLADGGAVFIGSTNITQCANSVTGINVSRYHGTPLNPYNKNFTVGGSSGGSAAAVAIGLCPVGLGSDAGGSIRTPAAYCGVVGLKATIRRFSTKGMLINSCTVGNSGPICGSVRDVAIFYGFLAEKDSAKGNIPPVNLDGFGRIVDSLKIGVDNELFKLCEREIETTSRKALEIIRNESNIDVVDIHIPEKQESYIGYVCTTSQEMSAGNSMLFDLCANEMDTYTTLFFNIGPRLTFNHYFQGAKQKTRCIKALTYLFSQVDVIALPVVGDPITRVDDSRAKYGCLDFRHLRSVTSNAFFGNYTGVPCISIPIGYSSENLPIGLQIMAPWWREDLLLRVALQIESLFVKKKPQHFYDIFDTKNPINVIH